MAKFCSKCGAELKEQTRFCHKCGHRMSGQAVSSTAPDPQANAPAKNQQVGAPKNQQVSSPVKHPQAAVPAQNQQAAAPVNPVPMQPQMRPPAAPVPPQAPPTQKKKKKGGLVVFLIMLVILAIVAVLLWVYPGFLLNGWGVKFKEFAADGTDFVSGADAEITFTVTADGASEKTEILLYSDADAKKPIGQMHDDGKKGDAEAGDGIYTYVVETDEEYDELTTLHYFCKAGRNASEKIAVRFFVQPDEDAAEDAQDDYNDIRDAILEVEEGFLNDNGFVEVDEQETLINEIKPVLDGYVEKGLILEYEVEENSIYIKYYFGLSSIYMPPVEGVDNVGSDVDMTIYTCQPSFTEMGGENFSTSAYDLPAGVDFVLEMMDVSAEDLEDSFTNYSFSDAENYDDSEVTLDVIRSFGSDQVILWHGHGGYFSNTKSILQTGEEFDWDAWWWDLEYFGDCVSNRIVNGLMTGYDRVLISSKYIARYCGDMENSFVYLAACQSGKTPELANAFADKGAAVVGNSDTIMRSYNVVMLYSTVHIMQQVNPETQEHYTLQEALDLSKTIYGESDADSRYGGIGATPMVFGGEDAEGYRFADEVATGTLSGKVCKASDRSTAIENAEIQIYVMDALYTTLHTDADGNYSAEMPRGEYMIKISASGYINFSCYAKVNADLTTYMETFLMVEGSETDTGVAGGTVFNSLSGVGVEGVQMQFVKDWNNTASGAEVMGEVFTDTDGAYSVELPLGNYTAILTKEGYSSSYFNIVVQSGTTENQDGTITPEINGDDYLITLTWDENPRDLDSHMVGMYSDRTEFHVYYSNKEADEHGRSLCSLDYDDTSSYGPEHITLSAKSSQPYYYYVHHYAGSGSLATSGAMVTVEQGNVVVAQFHVPTNLGSGDVWNVFAIKDGDLVVSNTITSSRDIEYAND